jgi:hypothetical protein
MLLAALGGIARAADLPVREVILFKHGVGYFARTGELKPGETARIDFKAEDMNDVLKSLTVTDGKGGKVSGIRYDASETLEKRLENFPFAVGGETSLAAFLDQMKGARLELKMGGGDAAGTIVSARLVKASEKSGERETVMLLMDSGDIRSFDLGAATAVRLTDPKLQALLKDYLAVITEARSKDRRSVFIDSDGSAAREMTVRYMTPAPVWKSSYRLLFGKEADPTLEGWAIIDNTSGEDWTNVRLSVVSGRPISFITQLYEPRYVIRPSAELAENRPVAPVVSEGAISMDALRKSAAPRAMAMPPPAPAAAAQSNAFVVGGRLKTEESTFAATSEGRDLGELFEYSFASPVTVKKGESAMLPFLQQKVGARKLLIYSESFGLHPMDAAEVTNSTGKTLDGGPITVYDAGSYAGEALVETLKAGDKRLISYGVDLGTRISTSWDSSRDVVREVHLHRGTLTTRSAVEETKTYTIHNVDAKAKTLIIEHSQRAGYKLLNLKPSEKTTSAYRFEVKHAASGTETFPVSEERLMDQTFAITSLTPDVLTTWVQNKALSDAGRRQLEQIAQKKREIADNDTALKNADTDLANLAQDQQRIRSNIQSLNNVSGQQDAVQGYARQLAASEAKIAAVRDRQAQLRTTKTRLESELNSMIEKADF